MFTNTLPLLGFWYCMQLGNDRFLYLYKPCRVPALYFVCVAGSTWCGVLG